MNTSLEADQRYILRAFELAKKSFALASPNPNVGALLVNDKGQIVGEGFYTYDRVKHAEVLAIEQAADRARASTLYINLEPCSHHGRTGPCADALIAAGVKRVVASIPDPNPQVSGRGFRRLEDAGVEVVLGILKEEARLLNDAFAKYIRHRIPLVTLKSAMTLDGKIAPPAENSGADPLPASGSPTWITGEQARAHVQELRHQQDAILVGVGTIIRDNPLLTDRTGLERRRPLLRVILDSHLRIPTDSRVVATAKDDVLVFCSVAEEKKKHILRERGIQVEQVAVGADGRPDLGNIFANLGAREITSIMIEGGAEINGAALASGAADKVCFYYAPKILGGTESVSFASRPGFRRMDEAAHLKWFRLHRLGEDFSVEGYLKDPYFD